MSELGVKVTNFTLMANGGRDVSLDDFAGQNVVIYFYPKDDTSGCTTEALDFTASLADFDGANTIILGVSKDSVRKHDNFIKKHDLGVTLLADTDGTVCETFGVWVEKKMYGRSYMGIERATFLLDANGVISNIWRKVKVKGHVAEVLRRARIMMGLAQMAVEVLECGDASAKAALSRAHAATWFEARDKGRTIGRR